MKENVIYLLKLGHYYKLGRADLWERRWKDYQRYSPFKLRVVFAISVPDHHQAEDYLLSLYRQQIVSGKKEWMTLTPRHVWRIKGHLLHLNRRTKPSPKPPTKGLNHNFARNPVWDLLATRLNGGS